jgi:hypothetical protein
VKYPLVNTCAHVIPCTDVTFENNVSVNQSPFNLPFATEVFKVHLHVPFAREQGGSRI